VTQTRLDTLIYAVAFYMYFYSEFTKPFSGCGYVIVGNSNLASVT
jgi:hypothetical protein